MERILKEDEKLRRAEEIYFKRNNRNVRLSHEEENKTKRYFGSKILLYIIVLFDIAVLIFCLQNKEYIFTKEFLSTCNEYNINISEKLNQVVKNFLVEDKVYQNIEENGTNDTLVSENIVNENKEEIKEDISTNTDIVENKTENVESSLSEMDLDVQNLKQIYRFVKPLEATISSGFGERESEYQNVTGYHKGIDLAAAKGTSIKAAMQGIVTLVSGEGDYRKTSKN